MAVEIMRDQRNGVVRCRVTSGFVPDEIDQALGPYYEKTPRGAHLFFLMDFSDLSNDPEPDHLLPTLMKLGERNPKVPVLGAFIAKGTLGFTPGRIIQPFYSKVGLRARVFQQDQEAVNWLLSGLE